MPKGLITLGAPSSLELYLISFWEFLVRILPPLPQAVEIEFDFQFV